MSARIALLLSASILAALLPSSAFAEPSTPTYCSGWQLVQHFQHRACVIYESSSIMGFEHQVENLESTAYYASVWSSKVVTNGSSVSNTDCAPAWTTVRIPAFSTHGFYCSVARHTGYKYKMIAWLQSSTGDAYYRNSPTKTG
jgi:hypothetical protein